MKKVLMCLFMSLSLMLVGCDKKTSLQNSLSIQTDVKEEKYIEGEIKDNIYTNESLNIKFTPSVELTIVVSDDKKKEILESGIEKVNENLDQDLDLNNYDTYTELTAINIYKGDNVLISSEKESLYNGMDINQYVSICAQQLKTTSNEYFKYEMYNIYSDKLCEKEYSVIDGAIVTNNKKALQRLYISKIGDRFVSISFTCSSEEGLNELLNCFEPLH